MRLSAALRHGLTCKHTRALAPNTRPGIWIEALHSLYTYICSIIEAINQSLTWDADTACTRLARFSCTLPLPSADCVPSVVAVGLALQISVRWCIKCAIFVKRF